MYYFCQNVVPRRDQHHKTRPADIFQIRCMRMWVLCGHTILQFQGIISIYKHFAPAFSNFVDIILVLLIFVSMSVK